MLEWAVWMVREGEKEEFKSKVLGTPNLKINQKWKQNPRDSNMIV